MDGIQQRELRDWAEALAAADAGERRAMGRAMLMLLDRIDELERELSTRPSEPTVDYDVEEEFEVEPAPVIDRTEHDSLEDTQPIGLRGRLRAAADRLHER